MLSNSFQVGKRFQLLKYNLNPVLQVNSIFRNCVFEFLAIGLEGARYTRVGGIPERGPENRFLTKSLWLNNNRLKTTKNIHELVNATIEYPSKLSWIDFSFNYITEIDVVRQLNNTNKQRFTLNFGLLEPFIFPRFEDSLLPRQLH